MSWPNSWQVQPGYGGYSSAIPPPQAAAVAASPAAYSTMSPEQYAQWQQWQQYQQQYAQWHAQYGEQYARQMGKPLPAVAAPMPMSAMGVPATNVPPPAIASVVPQSAPVLPPIVIAPPMPASAAPPPPSEPHPDTVAAGNAPPPPASDGYDQGGEKTPEELAFEEQFRKWEVEFENWKRKNANHPDKVAYREYEKKFEECRKKLLERREHLRKKRLAEIASAPAQQAAAGYQFNQPPPPPPPEESDGGMDVGLFKNALGGGGNLGGGIPGLDLIDDQGSAVKPPVQIDEEVMEVIELDDEKDEKPIIGPVGEPPKASPVNALASLLKDPKVSALLNIISGTNNGQGVSLSNLGNSELLQQIQTAAGAVINGSPGQGLAGLGQIIGPGDRTPLSDEPSRASFHEDRRSLLSGDERSHDFDEFNRGPPPSRSNEDFNRGPPPRGNRGPPPNRGSGFNFDASVPPPLMDIDYSRPPPIFGSAPPASRPVRSNQPSPSPSNTSSTSRRHQQQQRQSRFANNLNNIKQEQPELEPQPGPKPIIQQTNLQVKEEPFNGSDLGPPANKRYYEGPLDEQQLDEDEDDEPCAVPKPAWMTEDEYQEIYDKYENVEVFEERKYKMELAIRLLEQKKKSDRLLGNSKPPGFGPVGRFANSDNTSKPPGIGNNAGGGRFSNSNDINQSPGFGNNGGGGRFSSDNSKPPGFGDNSGGRFSNNNDKNMSPGFGNNSGGGGRFSQNNDNNKPSGFGDNGSGGRFSNSNNNNSNNSPGFGGDNSGGSSRWQGGMPKPIKQESGLAAGKRGNPFAADDDFFRPKQVIDYSNGTPRVIDYGHSSGPVASGGGDDGTGSGSRDDWNKRGAPQDKQQFNNNNNRGGRGPFQNDDMQPQRFDYNHTPSFDRDTVPDNVLPPLERPPHYSVNSFTRLVAMHENPNPDESNPCYPSKFILMNDNRPNRPSTKRGKRASSIRKQKMKQQQDDPHLIPNETPFAKDPQLRAIEVPAVARPNDYELEMSRDGQPSPFHSKPVPIVHIDDLLLPPGRFRRPQRICFIMRGLPGSGKSYLARLIKECEVKNGGQPPRVLSIDDYFLVESESREPDPVTGRMVSVTKSEYQFDASMEEVYMQNLVKAFKRTITEKLFNFVLVDCINERLEHYNEFHNFARSNGFKVYTCTLQTEIDLCIEQNIHKRSVDEIRAYANNWALGPDEHVLINACTLLDPQEEVPDLAADMDLCTEEDDDLHNEDALVEAVTPSVVEEDYTEPQEIDEDSNIDGAELGFFASKWDTDTTEQNLARLDGIRKPPRRPPTIEDFLADGDDLGDSESDRFGAGAPSSGKKRVRWADIEERNAQRKMRQMGFVVGVTDWSRMMDPTQGSSALTKTKYIERVRRKY